MKQVCFTTQLTNARVVKVGMNRESNDNKPLALSQHYALVNRSYNITYEQSEELLFRSIGGS